MNLSRTLVLLVFVFTINPLLATDFVAETHYHALQPVPPQLSGEEVEVVEFFWYGCPHCNDFEPHIEAWLEKKPENTVFTRIPVMFGGAANLHARVHYALEVIGEVERIGPVLFHALSVEKRGLKTQEEVEALLRGEGVDLEKFRSAMSSFAVQTKVNRATSLMRRYGVRGVPALVVDGRYRSGGGFGGYDEMIGLADFLVDKVRAERK